MYGNILDMVKAKFFHGSKDNASPQPKITTPQPPSTKTSNPKSSTPCPVCHNFQPDKFTNKKSVNSDYEGLSELRVQFPYKDVKTQAAQGCDSCKVLYEGVRFAWKYDHDPGQVLAGFVEGKAARVFLASSSDGSGFSRNFFMFSGLGNIQLL